jgi:hypothetical protein
MAQLGYHVKLVLSERPKEPGNGPLEDPSEGWRCVVRIGVAASPSGRLREEGRDDLVKLISSLEEGEVGPVRDASTRAKREPAM